MKTSSCSASKNKPTSFCESSFNESELNNVRGYMVCMFTQSYKKVNEDEDDDGKTFSLIYNKSDKN